MRHQESRLLIGLAYDSINLHGYGSVSESIMRIGNLDIASELAVVKQGFYCRNGFLIMLFLYCGSTLEMNKRRIYLDTSVISHLEEPRDPAKMADTHEFWKLLASGSYEIVLSHVVLDEIAKCSKPKFDKLINYLADIDYEIATSDEDTVALAEKFIDFGILKEKDFSDCRHIAAALISGCDIIASWNFSHMVNIKTIEGARKIATAGGYQDIMIYAPSSLI